MFSSLREFLKKIRYIIRHHRNPSLLLWRVTACSILIVCVGLPRHAISQNTVKLIAKPDSCVALHRGQPCFARIQLSWTEPVESDVCLYANDDNTPLVCLPGSRLEATVEHSSSTSTLYSLRIKNATQVLAEVVVRTAWVYRTGRKSSSGWRLF